jgi:hypothetical protein
MIPVVGTGRLGAAAMPVVPKVELKEEGPPYREK